VSPIPVYFEQGRRRVFACVLDWPGWCRRDKTEELALDRLAAYAPRYAVAARLAGLEPPDPGPAGFQATERLDSGFGADFGAPMEIPRSDAAPAGAEEARRMASLVSAAWQVFDRAAAVPAELRKGPRGGGRDLDKIIEHVAGADFSFARKLGVRHRSAPGDRAAVEAMRPASWPSWRHRRMARRWPPRAGQPATGPGGSPGMPWTMPGRSRTALSGPGELPERAVPPVTGRDWLPRVRADPWPASRRPRRPGGGHRAGVG